MAASRQQLAQAFLDRFTPAAADLAHALAAAADPAPPDLQQAQAALGHLRRELAGAAAFLPAYDQRQADEQLKALERAVDALKARTAPRKRFAFARPAAGRAAPPPGAATPPAAAAAAVEGEVVPASPPAPASGPVASSAAGQEPTPSVTLADRTDAFVCLPPAAAIPGSGGFGVTLANLERCVVSLFPPAAPSPADAAAPASPPPRPITTLHASSLTDVVVLAPGLPGSVLARGLARCTLVLGAGQVRVHDATATALFVRVGGADGGRAVLEGCEGVRYGPYLLDEVEDGPTPAVPPAPPLDFSHPNPTEPSPAAGPCPPAALPPLRALAARSLAAFSSSSASSSTSSAAAAASPPAPAVAGESASERCSERTRVHALLREWARRTA